MRTRSCLIIEPLAPFGPPALDCADPTSASGGACDRPSDPAVAQLLLVDHAAALRGRHEAARVTAAVSGRSEIGPACPIVTPCHWHHCPPPPRRS